MTYNPRQRVIAFVLFVVLFSIILDFLPWGMQRTEAVSLRLLSSEYPPLKDRTVEERVVVDSLSQHCLLFTLSDDTPHVSVTFSYSSNSSHFANHFPLVVTTHFPSAPYANVIAMHDLKNVIDTHVYSHSDLVYDPKSDRGKENKQKKITVKMYALRTDANGIPDTKGTTKDDGILLTGAYGMCFGLDNPSVSFKRNIFEVVSIEVRNVVFGREEVKNSPGGPEGRVGHALRGSRLKKLSGADKDALNAFEEGVRKLYHADQTTDVYKLLVENNFISSQTMRTQLEKVGLTMDKLSRVQDLARWQRERELSMRGTSESTYTRLWISALLLLGALSLVLSSTFSFAKNIMIKQKVI